MDNRIRSIQRYSSPTITDLARAGLIQLAPPIQRNVSNLKRVVSNVLVIAKGSGNWPYLGRLVVHGPVPSPELYPSDLQKFWWCNQPTSNFDNMGYPDDYHYLDPHNWDLDMTNNIYQMGNAADESVMPSGWEAWGVPHNNR